MMEVTDGYELVGYQERTGLNGQPLKITLVRPVRQSDAHVDMYKSHMKRVKFEKEQREAKEERRLKREERRLKREECRAREEEIRKIKAKATPEAEAVVAMKKAGLSIEKIAEVFDISPATVKRRIAAVKAAEKARYTL